MDKRGGPALKQMEEKRVNMWGVRRTLGIRSMQAKIEERVLRRIGNVLRMDNANEKITASIEKQRSLVCQWPECGKILKSITGRKNYEKIHRAKRQQETLCKWCSTTLKDKISLTSHQKYCMGAPKGICPYCGERKSVANMARHKRMCAMGNERMYTLTEEERNTQQEKRENEKKGDLVRCELCNYFKSKTNISRHRRICIATRTNSSCSGNRIPTSR